MQRQQVFGLLQKANTSILVSVLPLTWISCFRYQPSKSHSSPSNFPANFLVSSCVPFFLIFPLPHSTTEIATHPPSRNFAKNVSCSRSSKSRVHFRGGYPSNLAFRAIYMACEHGEHSTVVVTVCGNEVGFLQSANDN